MYGESIRPLVHPHAPVTFNLSQLALKFLATLFLTKSLEECEILMKLLP
ncbi:MAG: hypothetical protein BWX84_02247 [Verrucomicrobia bacterium ADurb.Bin118]|nr:MAG: hypothetical protein BWX84_02247 [Verrucomicrobia bacterium ADurb.Bin118]